MRRGVLIGLSFAALTVGTTRAEDSVFGIRGLGLLGRPISARASGTGGGFALFDHVGTLNPATLGRWRAVAGFAVGAPSQRSFSDGGATTKLSSTRFPLFGFATTPGRRLVVGAAFSDYLDRTWAVRRIDTLTLRGVQDTVFDFQSSIGGVTDFRLAAAYRVSEQLDVGIGLHALTGSTRLTVARDFKDTTFTDFAEVAVTDFRGMGISAGAVAQLGRLSLSGSLRLNGNLGARASTGLRARIPLPLEAGLGVLFVPAPGVAVAGSFTYAGWSRAGDALVATGHERAKDATSIGVGAEFEAIRVFGQRLPLRVGYRTRTLPFPVNGAQIDERAVSGGFGIELAGGRTTLDLALESGSRSVGTQKESFTSAFVGIIIRP